MSEQTRDAAGMSSWPRRNHVRAFYSGHSLTEGIPEIAAQIAGSLGSQLDFETQVLSYSLLRQRTKGEVASASDWPGYRSGQNREGAGLDVAEELRQPRRLAPGDIYDVLVVTERHDLPAIARKERTAFYLIEMAKHLMAGNPDAEVFLYQSWLPVNLEAPRRWIDYERAVLPMWECIASRSNLELPPLGNMPRVRILPGGSALAELAAALWEGSVPGVASVSPAERVGLLFSDNVHMSEFGRYFVALVNYAVLFGGCPEGAAISEGISPVTGRHLQTLAGQFAFSYGRRADAVVGRDMAACRELMQKGVCPAYVALRHGDSAPIPGAIKRLVKTYSCCRDYANAYDRDNPFASLEKR
ncbi:hypothetical protein QA645_32220 [Bradyrhizobium sp. CIAT3101]|uniref:hypothetical protein n=1 Tax=Bradyrhizobium sp. CIAT3101 TaxID=439387 RepID=UPI0024B03D32|nr:hypothetical protein [Bradyrhizobium sp. CIAT3101]WFU79163.1 hypothetical protein QA645_32220 [Bradyrhizobium sp. CIAT3101]